MVLAVVCVAIAVAGYIIGPELFWPIALQQYFLQVLMMPVIVALTFSITLGRCWKLAAISSSCVFVTFVMGCELNTGAGTTKKLRLMTYNVKGYLAAGKPSSSTKPRKIDKHKIRDTLGDLNAPVHSLVVRVLLDTGARDAFSIAGRGFGYTYGHSLWPGISFLRIDHVLVRSEFNVANCFAGDKQDSTHRAVVVDIILKNRQEKD